MVVDLRHRVEKILRTTREVRNAKIIPFTELGRIINKRFNTVFSGFGVLEGYCFHDSYSFTNYFVDVTTPLRRMIPVFVSPEQYKRIKEGTEVTVFYNLVKTVTLDYVPPNYRKKIKVGTGQVITNAEILFI